MENQGTYSEKSEHAIGEEYSILREEMMKNYPTIMEGWEQIYREQTILFMKKHLDYGTGNIAAGTTLSTLEEIKFSVQGLWFRISDKINRWKNIMLTGNARNESLMDTFQDIANYAIIVQMVAKGLWRK